MTYDWVTWDEAKYGTMLKPALWNSSGRFVSLDHDVPLGGPNSTTGISVTEYYSNGGTPPGQ